MDSAGPKVIHLRELDAHGALERLNRITGLRFARWPQSLASLARQAAGETPPAEATEPVACSVESA